MPEHDRDPYATQPAPKSKSGPMLRYVIAAGLLAAAGIGYTTMRDGPGLMDAPQDQTVLEQTTTLADASQDAGYQVSQSEFAPPPAATPAPTPAPAARSAPRAAPVAADPAPEPVLPPVIDPVPAAPPAATPLPPDA